MTFGFNNLHYSIFDEESKTYDTPQKITGAISLTLSPVEVLIHRTGLNSIETLEKSILTGYKGTLSVYDLPEKFLSEIFGYETDAAGDLIQKESINDKKFALLCESMTPNNRIRVVFYNCKCTSNSINIETLKESTVINPLQIPIFCVSNENKEIRKICREGNINYNNFFERVI